MPNVTANTVQATPTLASLAGSGLHDVASYTPATGAHILHIGADQQFATVASALAAARDGDVLLVQAGTYVNDFASVTAKVSIIGVGGMVNMVATASPPNGKAILCVDTDCTIQNLSFSGCAVPDANGAGIRYEGGNLTLQNCSFHDNENGLLSAPVPGGTLLIQNCDFGHNGNGSGYTHNLYVGAIKQLIVENSVFHDANVGHELKSRALNSLITGNVFTDGPGGNGSYSIDLPDGGKAVISGNVIEKGPQTENQNIIHFGGEGIPYAGSSLLVRGNQITNDRAGAVAVLNQTPISVSVTGNSFTNLDPASIAAGPARVDNNIDSPNADGTGTPLPDAVLLGILPGRTQFFTDALDHQVTVTDSGIALQGGAGRLRVQAVAGHIIVEGGVGGLDLTETPGSGGNEITTATGSANSVNVSGQDTIESDGTDAITTGQGNVTAQVSGNATINEGGGNNQWSVLGNLHLTGNGGAPRFTLDSAASLTLDGALSYFNIQSNGGPASYDVRLGGTRVDASLMGGAWSMWGANGFTSFNTAGGPDGVTMRFGAGTVQVVSSGADEIWAGSGALTVQASGAADIHAGTGTLAVYGRGWSGANVWGAGGTYVIDGDSGGITYHGGDQDSTVQANLSSITLLGGAGHLTVQAGGRQTITGGAGGLTVNRTDRSGDDTITTQAGSTNTVSLSDGTMDSWGNDTITQPWGNNTLTIHGSATIQGSTGNSHINVLGHAALAGRGGDWLTLAPGADAAVQAGGYLGADLTQAALSVTVPGGDASLIALSVQNATGSVVVQDGQTADINTSAVPGGTAITVDGGTSHIRTGSASQVHAGAGTATVQITGSDSEVWGGSGQLTLQDWDWTAGDAQTVHGGTGSINVAGSNSDLTFIGGSGAAVLDGAARNLRIQGGAGSITLANGWASSTSFVGGSGDATLALSNGGGAVTFGVGNTAVQEIGWGGAVNYTATGTSGGTQTIVGFRVGTDSLHLAGTALAAEATSGTATTLTTTAGARVVLQGVTAPVELIVDPTSLLDPVLPPLLVSPTPSGQPAPSATAQAAAAPVPATVALVTSSDASAPAASVAASNIPVSSVAPATSGLSEAAPRNNQPAPAPPAAALPATSAPSLDVGTVPGMETATPTLPEPAVPAPLSAGIALPAAVPSIQSQPATPPDTAAAPVADPVPTPVPAAAVPIPATPGAQPGPAADPATPASAAAVPVPAVPDVQTQPAALPASGSLPSVTPAPTQPALPAATTTPVPDAAAPVSQAQRSSVAAPAAPQPTSPAFAVIETATGQTAQSSGDTYAGPVEFLQRQFIWSGNSGIVVSATTPDVFLHGGGGDDALAADSGSNVLDGGAGSNFLVGGTGADGGADTFFVDGRSGATWSTIVNFHHGDALTLWGFQPGVSTAPWTASDGVAGYTGATLHSELAGAGTGVNASATFAGLTMNDVQDKLTVSSGTVGNLSYLNVAYTG